jgi:hypothetical protein
MTRTLSRLSGVGLAAALAAGCGGGGSSLQRPEQYTTEHAAGGRFTVVLTGEALRSAESVHVDLRKLVSDTLGRVDAVLPGPKTIITVDHGESRIDIVPDTGTGGETDRTAGTIQIVFGATSKVGLSTVLRTWLPEDLAHETDHSVRILAGPGYGTNLLQWMVSEGLATAFGEAFEPGPPAPSGRAITPAQECAFWKRARPLLGHGRGLDGPWMYGDRTIPRWTGYTIGHDIVTSYRRHHPGVGWRTLTVTPASQLLAGSHYRPCPATTRS